jgi:predicted transcriptional regulator
MTVQEIVHLLQAEVIAGSGNLNREISGGYASDLLSNVMSQGQIGNIWITMHGHQNIVAVASLLGLAAVIIAGNVEADKEAITKADAEEMPLLTTTLSVFEVVGLLYSKGITGG